MLLLERKKGCRSYAGNKKIKLCRYNKLKKKGGKRKKLKN